MVSPPDDTLAAGAGKQPQNAVLLGPGTDLGPYRLERLLGEGGMGQVYLAEHRKLGRQVAIKLLLPDLAEDPDIIRRFFHEARAVNQIRHEHIVEIFDFVEEVGGLNYFIMEYLDGLDLMQTRRRDGPFPVRRTVQILDQVCSALGAAHAKGVVHRDLKPDNVFLTHRTGRDDFVKLLDFGIAKMNALSTVKTTVGVVLGTPLYMSPEQAEGRRVDERSDLYSLGVLLHWMLFDELPPHARPASVSFSPRAMRTTSSGGNPIPAPLLDLTMQCLRFEPEKRPPSADAVREVLGQIYSAAPARAPTPRTGLASPLRSRGTWILAGGLALAVALAASLQIISRSEARLAGATARPASVAAIQMEPSEIPSQPIAVQPAAAPPSPEAAPPNPAPTSKRPLMKRARPKPGAKPAAVAPPAPPLPTANPDGRDGEDGMMDPFGK